MVERVYEEAWLFKSIFYFCGRGTFIYFKKKASSAERLT